jgi:ATP-dependent Clp protease ATP-binding subunit ClpC
VDERFTDDARKVLELAVQESRRLEVDYLGTEHLLHGLISLRGGIAFEVLTALKADFSGIRLATENLARRDLFELCKSLNIDLSNFGPEIESLRQRRNDRIKTGEVQQTPRARNVIDYAKEEAQSLGNNYVGTEHILVGLLREDEGVAAQLLMNHGLKLDTVRDKIRSFAAQPVREGQDGT